MSIPRPLDMEKESTQVLQAPIDGNLAGPSSSAAVTLNQQMHGVTAHDGNVVLAGGNVKIENHYHTRSEPKLGVEFILRLVCNLRQVHLDALSKVTPGTGVWFFDTYIFFLWMDPNGDLKILWGTGIPGAGKTVMVSIVINEIESRAAAVGNNTCVAYVYFRYSDAADLTVRSVLEILVKQTVERHPTKCAPLAEETYSRHLRENTQPTEAELLQLLQRFTGAFLTTFYFLDALDEAPDKLQLELVKKLASLNVRLFITSRPLKNVESRITGVHSFPIFARAEDIELHIQKELGRSPDLQILLEKGGPSLREEVISSIKKNCGGMFLHASLQLDALCDCVTFREVKRTLETFPSDIEDVYRQTWNRILKRNPTRAPLAKAVLLWVLYASRSMTIGELERAVATSPETYKFERGDLVSGMTLVTFCRGLVTIEEKTRVIRLVHYTAKGVLRELLHSSFPLPHSYIAKVCLTHLVESGFQNTNIRSWKEFTIRLKNDPLLAYASNTWVVHARECLDVEDTRQWIANFIRQSSSYPMLTGQYHFDILRPLHILAIHNLPISLITHDKIDNPNVVTQIYYDSPLTLASSGGHIEIVKILLACAEIQVNLVEGQGQAALMIAASKGHESVVVLLLARPEIQVNLVDKGGRSALMWAAEHGHQCIVKLLLARPEIRVNLVDKGGKSALMRAANYGRESVVKLLLARPEIQVNLACKEGWSALMRAAYRGYQGIVKILLERPEVPLNFVANKGWSVLMWAAFGGHNDIVKLLLAYPEIQVNLLSNGGQSALTLAARYSYGFDDVVQLLLARSEIQVNSVDHHGWSALMKASRIGSGKVVNALLTRSDIQVNLVDKEGVSALMMAIYKGRPDVAKSLLARPEIQVNLVATKGWSALKLAVAFGGRQVLKLLLAHPKIHVNLVDDKGSSALIRAARFGRSGIVKPLLAHPEIQVNLVDNKGWSALMQAAYNGHTNIVKLLCACPEVQVNLVSNDGWPALMLAACNGYEGIFNLLLAHPETQPNLVNNEGCSVLMQAAGHGQKGIVKLLLTRSDIQVNLTDNEGCSALMKATRHGQRGIAKLLLARSDILVNLTNSDGWSVIMLAASSGHQNIVKLLLARPEINVNLAGNDGWRALTLACCHGRKGIVELLIAHPETQVNFVDSKGWSALMLAAYGGHEAIVRLLLDAPHTTTTAHSTNDGHTAISLALSQGHDGIVQLLEEFEYRRERSDATGLSLGALVDLERLSSKEAVGESVSEYDSEGSETYYDAEEQLEWEEI